MKKNTGNVLCEVGVLVVSAGTCRLQSTGFATASLVLLYHQSQGGVCLTLPFVGEVAISPPGTTCITHQQAGSGLKI